jgi:hypothetical protein
VRLEDDIEIACGTQDLCDVAVVVVAHHSLCPQMILRGEDSAGAPKNWLVLVHDGRQMYRGNYVIIEPDVIILPSTLCGLYLYSANSTMIQSAIES